jgi:hypothetical protein
MMKMKMMMIIVIIRGTTYEDTISTICPLIESDAVNMQAIWCIFIVAKTLIPHTDIHNSCAH